MIPSVFAPDGSVQESWVLDGQGDATPMWDGLPACVMGGDLYKGCGDQSWCKVGITPSDKPFVDAWALLKSVEEDVPDGTYELCGPDIKGNPHGFTKHVLIRHRMAPFICTPHGTEELSEFMVGFPYRGIVWYHPDGRRAKVTKQELGLAWP